MTFLQYILIYGAQTHTLLIFVVIYYFLKNKPAVIIKKYGLYGDKRLVVLMLVKGNAFPSLPILSCLRVLMPVEGFGIAELYWHVVEDVRSTFLSRTTKRDCPSIACAGRLFDRLRLWAGL